VGSVLLSPATLTLMGQGVRTDGQGCLIGDAETVSRY
jgi:hypothetical protein